MTTEHEETEKLRPCPWCGKKVEYWCEINGVLNIRCVPCYYSTSTERHSSSYVWKLLDEKTETIRSQDEKIKELETGIRGMASQIDLLGKRETELMVQIRRLREAVKEIIDVFDHDSDLSIGELNIKLYTVLRETNTGNRESDK